MSSQNISPSIAATIGARKIPNIGCVQFGEDSNRTRSNYAAENLALLRWLNLIRQNGKPRDRLGLRRL